MSLERLRGALANRYGLERELGQGGMATVYLAEDLKHNRKVAIKVLKPELAAVLGAERFVQEIKTTAALSHPHILPLFDSGEAGGFLYYVMPYVEGETLRDRLNRETQLGVDESVALVREVADALQYAHEHGVVHRDIKPENILLHAGRPMVADFGIALAVSAAAGGRMTETGLSLGTPHYMSPEQATAEKEITGRSDIYSLAAVLYEMLTGNPPHMGSSAQQIIMRIITDMPRPVTELRKAVPPNVAAAVAKALEKLPADRFASARAFADALGDARFTTATPSAASSTARDWRQRLAMPMVAAIALLSIALAWSLLRKAPDEPLSMQPITLGIVPDAQPVGVRAAIAPDGSSIVYADSVDGVWRLVRKMRDQIEGTPIAGTENGVQPFFSPEGDEVGFRTRRGGNARLWKVPIEGGPPVPLADHVMISLSAATWMDDGSILYVSPGFDLMRVSASGGASALVVNGQQLASKGPTRLVGLPGSKGVLFSGCAGNCVQQSVYALDLRSNKIHLLVDGATGVWYASTGQVIYTTSDGRLEAAPFDADKLALRGPAVPIYNHVPLFGFALSASGTALINLVRQDPADSAELVWVSRDGSAVPVDSTWKGDFRYPAISPDGRSVAVSITEGTQTDVWIRQFDTERQQRLTSEGSLNWRPAWSPDGMDVAFLSNRLNATAGEAWDVFVKRADATTPARLLADLTPGMSEVGYADETTLLLAGPDPSAPDSGRGSGRRQVFARRLHGDTALKRLLTSPFNRNEFSLSPNGKWLAFNSNEPGRGEVVVVPFPDVTSDRKVVSVRGGFGPRWAHSGKELFFMDPAGTMMSAAVLPGAGIRFAVPRPLFSTAPYVSFSNHQSYDVAPDDRRFLMIRQPARTGADRVIYVENFFAELKRRMPR